MGLGYVERVERFATLSFGLLFAIAIADTSTIQPPDRNDETSTRSLPLSSSPALLRPVHIDRTGPYRTGRRFFLHPSHSSRFEQDDDERDHAGCRRGRESEFQFRKFGNRSTGRFHPFDEYERENGGNGVGSIGKHFSCA